MLPCGHYTTGETPYKFMDGWYIGSFIYSAFKQLATLPRPPTPEKELVAQVTKSNLIRIVRLVRFVLTLFAREEISSSRMG